jgi:pimeloyl-ACP methyl ester carboxylesterase
MHARDSYRANDPARPTVCLIHGLNSTSSVFWHMVGPIEEAGYGVVVYDFPYNRDLDESAEAFRKDWAEFRKKSGDRRAWAIVAHSMGALLARAYVEDDRAYAGDVASMILIAPVNRGSNLSRVQTIHQAMQGLKAVQGGSAKGEALAKIGDGVGAAAEDMTPGSAFLRELNARKRREGMAYHTLAGKGGFLSPTARRQIEVQLGLVGRPAMLGGLARLALGDLPAQLDEVTEGTGDGCVSVASTRLEGVEDHVAIGANHLELIRAPLLYPEPGPVACMPYVLRWLAKDLPVPADRGVNK